MTEFTHRLPHEPWRKPSRNEEEYFRQKEFRERMRKAREREARRETREREEMLERHGGHCPACASPLELLELSPGTAKQCPSCLGVWMDHETFDRLTHPDEPNEYLTGILRGLFLQFTTGTLHPEREDEEDPPEDGR